MARPLAANCCLSEAKYGSPPARGRQLFLNSGTRPSAPHLIRDLIGINTYVNADLIADGLAGFSADQVGLKAGRIMIDRLKELGGKGESFAFETTLAGKNYARFLQKLKLERNYNVHIMFLWLRSPMQAISRVRDRVIRGGHDISEEVIRRRYHRGVDNFFHIYAPIADSWTFLDNSNPDGPEPIANKTHSKIPTIADSQKWCAM
ncbi:MAG: hypothetical protein QNJ97_14330 [Myxococcota bacterium]|nr:hypothetical protein [Myxococcota bacterium]